MMIELRKLKNNFFLLVLLVVLLCIIYKPKPQLTTTSFITESEILTIFDEYNLAIKHNFSLNIKIIDKNYFSLESTDPSGIFVIYDYKNNACNLTVYKNTRKTALSNYLESNVEFKTILFHEFSHCLQSYNFNIKKDAVLLKGLSAEIFADGIAINLNPKNKDVFLFKRQNADLYHKTYLYIKDLNCVNEDYCYKKIFDIAKNIF